MQNNKLTRIKTISEFHRKRGLPPPLHPLISVIDGCSVRSADKEAFSNLTLDFYTIFVRKEMCVKLRYGQQQYDFDEGIMFFIAPKQVFGIDLNGDPNVSPEGWFLLIHPDFLWNTPLAKNIQRYEFFDYAVNEALFLSEKEETALGQVIQHIKEEYLSNIDKFSQGIIISQIETLLNYAERFYQRQFITRKKTNHQVLDRLEELLNDYFNSDEAIKSGLPTVQFISDKLGVSPSYLTGLLKSITGQNTQQHIHEKLIEKAKERLSTTNLSVSEIAYELGFGHPQSFSKLFKSKTNLSPQEFRSSFN
jgi:AraC-like DNA-binding protein